LGNEEKGGKRERGEKTKGGKEKGGKRERENVKCTYMFMELVFFQSDPIEVSKKTCLNLETIYTIKVKTNFHLNEFITVLGQTLADRTNPGPCFQL